MGKIKNRKKEERRRVSTAIKMVEMV